MVLFVLHKNFLPLINTYILEVAFPRAWVFLKYIRGNGEKNHPEQCLDKQPTHRYSHLNFCRQKNRDVKAKKRAGDGATGHRENKQEAPHDAEGLLAQSRGVGVGRPAGDVSACWDAPPWTRTPAAAAGCWSRSTCLSKEEMVGYLA